MFFSLILVAVPATAAMVWLVVWRSMTVVVVAAVVVVVVW